MGFNCFGFGFGNIWPTSLRVVFPWLDALRFSQTSKGKSARGKSNRTHAKLTKKTNLTFNDCVFLALLRYNVELHYAEMWISWRG